MKFDEEEVKLSVKKIELSGEEVGFSGEEIEFSGDEGSATKRGQDVRLKGGAAGASSYIKPLQNTDIVSLVNIITSSRCCLA